jgi:hypothetical protein
VEEEKVEEEVEEEVREEEDSPPLAGRTWSI